MGSHCGNCRTFRFVWGNAAKRQERVFESSRLLSVSGHLFVCDENALNQ